MTIVTIGIVLNIPLLTTVFFRKIKTSKALILLRFRAFVFSSNYFLTKTPILLHTLIFEHGNSFSYIFISTNKYLFTKNNYTMKPLKTLAILFFAVLLFSCQKGDPGKPGMNGVSGATGSTGSSALTNTEFVITYSGWSTTNGGVSYTANYYDSKIDPTKQLINLYIDSGSSFKILPFINNGFLYSYSTSSGQITLQINKLDGSIFASPSGMVFKLFTDG